MWQGFSGLFIYRKIARKMREIKQKILKFGKGQKEKSLKNVVFSRLFSGGGRGIRTPVRFSGANCFQDSLVMTASICLRIGLCFDMITQKNDFVNDFTDFFYIFQINSQSIYIIIHMLHIICPIFQKINFFLCFEQKHAFSLSI